MQGTNLSIVSTAKWKLPQQFNRRVLEKLDVNISKFIVSRYLVKSLQFRRGIAKIKCIYVLFIKGEVRKNGLHVHCMIIGLKTVALRRAHHTKRQKKSLICIHQTSKNDPKITTNMLRLLQQILASKKLFQELPGCQGKGLTRVPPAHQNNMCMLYSPPPTPRTLFASLGRSLWYSFPSVYTWFIIRVRALVLLAESGHPLYQCHDNLLHRILL
jgi:hypothetical protein